MASAGRKWSTLLHDEQSCNNFASFSFNIYVTGFNKVPFLNLVRKPSFWAKEG